MSDEKKKNDKFVKMPEPSTDIGEKKTTDNTKRFTIPERPALALKSMVDERNNVTTEYNKKIDLYLFGILEGNNIPRENVVNFDFENMVVTYKEN